MGASNSADIVTAITQGLSSMLFNIRPTVLPGCAANITFSPEVVTSVGVAKVREKANAAAVACLGTSSEAPTMHHVWLPDPAERLLALILCCCHSCCGSYSCLSLLSRCYCCLQSLSFREHIAVPAGVTQPVVKCEVSFSADSGELARQVVTIHTGVGGGEGFVVLRMLLGPSMLCM